MSDVLIGRIITREDRQLAVLAQTYPAWRIVRASGGWWANRLRPLTAAQRTAGLVPSIARADAVALSSALSAQDGIAQRRRDM
jgi:hypothetical protein